MAGDVAQLGLAVDSSQVKSATTALNQLSTASQSATTATDKLMASTGRSESQVRSIQAAASRLGVTFHDMAARVDAASTSHQKLGAASATALKGIQNLSNQAKSAANDNGTFQKSTEASNSSLEKLGNTLTRRVLFAFAAKEVRDLAVYVWNLNAAIAATADAAQRSGVGGQQFQGLSTAAAYKGVGGDAFNTAMVAFNQQIDLAKHGIGDLQTLLTSNGKTVSDTATTFGVVADLVKNAGSEAQKFSILQQAGLPATREFAKLMEQGSESIKKQGDAATKLTNQQLEDAKRIDEAWQRGWTNFENFGKRAVVNTIQSVGTIWSRGFGPNPEQNMAANALRSGVGNTLGNGSDVSGFYKGLGTGNGPQPTPTFDPARAKQQIALEQQRLAILSPLATAEDVVRQKQLEINAAALNNVGISKSQADSLKLVALAQFEMGKVGQQASIGVFDLAAAQKAANDNLQALVAQHLLDPKNAEQWAAAVTNSAKAVEQLAQQAKVAAAPLEGLQRLANEAGSVRTQLDQFATTSFNAVTPALRDMLLGTTNLSDGFKNLGMTIVSALTDAIIKITIIKPLIDALQSSLNGSGLLSFLTPGGGAAAQASSASTLSGNTGGAFYGPGFADGGTLTGGWGVVGEKGPELIRVHGGGVTVIPNHISKPYLPGFADGGMLNSSGGVSRLPFDQNNQPNITFNVIEDSSRAGQREQKQSGDETVITQYVDAITAKNAANPGSATSQVLNQRGRLASR